MTASPEPLNDLDQRLRARLAQVHRNELEEIGEEPLAWLAVAPVWTERLAASAEFPVGSLSLSECLDRAERRGLLTRGRDGTTGASREQVQVLLQLAPFLNGPQLGLALDKVAAIADAGSRSQALVRLTPHLPDEALARAAAAARSLAEPADRAAALGALSQRMTSPGRQAFVTEALAAAEGLPDRVTRAQVLLAVWPDLTVGQRDALAGDVIGRATSGSAPGLLQALVPLMSPESLGPLAAELLSEKNQDTSVQVADFSVLAARLTEPLRSSLLSAARAVARSHTDPAMRSAARSDVVSMLIQAGMFGEALEMINAIEDEHVRNYTLGLVADGLAHAGRYEEASDATGHLLDATARTDPAVGLSVGSSVLRRLAQVGPTAAADTITERLLNAAASVSGDASTVPALAEAAEALRTLDEAAARQLLDRAIAAARAVPDRGRRSETLMELAARLSGTPREELLTEAASTIRSVIEPRQRLRKLIELVPLLSANERPGAVEEVLQLLEPADADRTFWMPDAQRRDVLDRLCEVRDPDWLARTAADAADRVDAVLRPAARPRKYRAGRRRSGVLVPSGMARWARLGAVLASEGPAAAARDLDQLIGELCDVGDTAAAMAWAETAALLAQSVGGELEGASLLAARRVERQHRHIQDRRYLQDFLPREGQLKQFLDMVDASSPAWALHYIGMPGVGKTMLIRYVAADLAPARRIPIARVDFDRLNPAYPLTRPGQLLLEFAEELRPYLTDPRHQHLLPELKARVVQLHETIGHSHTPADPRATQSRTEFRGVLDVFNDLLRILPQPVVLILDTCEELTKLRPAGIQLPAIDATFAVLERIHEAVSSVRVVFAGRRLLACDGADWPRGIGTSAALPSRPYLRLHEIRGFTDDEAAQYLSRAIGPRLTPALRAAILAGSPETGRALERQAGVSEPARYSPFDLALYADWARAVPELSPEDIASEHSDQYIEVRIISRLTLTDVPFVLPAVALLGRFDTALLRSAYDGGDAAFADLWRELTALEWMDYQPDETLGRAFLEVQPGVLRRLRRYYARENASALAVAQRRLAAGLAQLIDREPLDQLRADHLDAAMRLLPRDDGARLWSRLEPRIAESCRWDWAHGVTERLLAEGGAVSDAAHPARAAVEATLCAALVHEQRELDIGELWRDVMAHAEAHPDPTQRAMLRHRAALGQIAADRARADASSPTPASDLASLLQPSPAVAYGPPQVEQLAAAGCAALDAYLDRLDSGGSAPRLDPDPITGWARNLLLAGVCDEVTSFAWMLAARALAKARDPGVDEALGIALECLPVPAPQGQPQIWSDWSAPGSIHDRVRLEALRISPDGAATPGQRADWQQEAIARADLVDAERLAAAVLQLELNVTPVPIDRLAALADAYRYRPERQATCAAHRATPPLFAVIADGLAALPGGCDPALALLDRRLADATATGRDEPAIQAAQREKLRVLRRMRLGAVDPGLVIRLMNSADVDDVALALPVVALTEQPDSPALPPRPHPELAHAWWRSRPAPTLAAAKQAIAILTEETGQQQPERPADHGWLTLSGHTYRLPLSPGFDQLSVALDWVEAALLTRTSIDVRELHGLYEHWLDFHPEATDDDVRLVLRAWALSTTVALPLPYDIGALDAYDPRTSRQPPVLARLADALGKRRIARLAMDEGELLSLRLKINALPLLHLACRLYADAGDAFGELCALVCAASTMIRASASRPYPPPGPEWPVLDDLRGAYERLGVASQAAVPPWHDLCDGGTSPDDLVARLAPWLAGWAERLVLTVDLLRQGGRAHDRRPTLEALRYLAARYPDGPPTELALGPPPDERPVQALRRRRWWVRFLVWAVPIVIFIGSAVVDYSLSDNGQRNPPVIANVILLSLFVAAFLTMAVLVLVSSGRSLGRGVTSALAARSDVRLSIVPVQAQLPAPDPTKVDALLRIRLQSPVPAIGWRLSRPGAQVIADGIFRGSATEQLDIAAAGVPPPIAGQLAKLTDRLRRRHVTVCLDVGYSLSAVPWEAFLGHAVARLGRRRRALRFARTTRPLSVAPLPRTRRGVLFLCSREWLSFVHAVWGPHVVVDESEGAPATPVSLIHLLGTPVQTSAGRRVSVGGIEQDMTRGVPIEAAVRAADLIDPARMPIGDQTLVVVQQEPTSATLVTTDRERSAALRAFAADVFLAGAAAVVFIPALAPSAARDALGPLTRAARRPMEPDQLLRALEKVRKLIPDQDLAAEITVFVDKGWFGGIP